MPNLPQTQAKPINLATAIMSRIMLGMPKVTWDGMMQATPDWHIEGASESPSTRPN
jgi:hypothetical protein